jgi:hypothetical protein
LTPRWTAVISKPFTGYTAADYAIVVGVGLTGSSG